MHQLELEMTGIKTMKTDSNDGEDIVEERYTHNHSVTLAYHSPSPTHTTREGDQTSNV